MEAGEKGGGEGGLEGKLGILSQEREVRDPTEMENIDISDLSGA